MKYQFLIIFILFLVDSCLIIGCNHQLTSNVDYKLTITNEDCGLNKKIIKIEKKDILEKFCVELAIDPAKRAKGLMYRDYLPKNEGMLFIFEQESIQSFWMKDTLIPLDMLFFDKDGKLINHQKNVQPCKSNVCESYISEKEAKYVLEINPGILP